MSHLHRAARLGQAAEVAECLAQGESVDAFSVHGFTPLMLAAWEGHVEAVRLLIAAGADFHLTTSFGCTALHLAAAAGHLEVAPALVAGGVPVDARNRDGRTPALEVARSNHAGVAALLHAHGADPELRDGEGWTAGDWLAVDGWPGRLRQEHPELFELPRRARPGAEETVGSLMAEEPSADAFAARRGRRICIWSYGGYRYEGPGVGRWAQRVAQVLFKPGLLAECEERFLQGEELEEARRCRVRRARAEERRARHPMKSLG